MELSPVTTTVSCQVGLGAFWLCVPGQVAPSLSLNHFICKTGLKTPHWCPVALPWESQHKAGPHWRDQAGGQWGRLVANPWSREAIKRGAASAPGSEERG